MKKQINQSSLKKSFRHSSLKKLNFQSIYTYDNWHITSIFFAVTKKPDRFLYYYSTFLTTSLQTCFTSATDECQSSWKNALKKLESSVDGVLQQWTDTHRQWPSRRRHGSLRCRYNASHRAVEVRNSNVDTGRIDLQLVAAFIDLWVSTTKGTQSCLSAQRFQISSTVSCIQTT